MTVAPRDGWSVERRADTARALHEPWPSPDQRRRRTVALCSVLGPRAIVLGSTQAADVVDTRCATAEGVDVVRRSSGGGAVMVAPGAQVWMDVWIPRGDPLWDDDVIRSSRWLGEAWARALEELGCRDLVVHRGRATRTEWSGMVCFAGVGPGEVTVGRTKVVGVAQRRTRPGARIHSMALMSWEPASLLGLLWRDSDHTMHVDGGTQLEGVATGISTILPAPRRDMSRGARRVGRRGRIALCSAVT